MNLSKSLLIFFDQYAEMIKVNSQVETCRDPKDNFLLSLAIDGKVDFLVTGDNDLLVLEQIEKTEIVSFKEFVKRIK